MIDFIQNENLITGSKEALDNLASNTNARVLLISDSHGGSSVFKQIILDYGKSCDALVFTGDGAGDLARLIDEAEKNPELKEAFPSVLAYAKGNNDAGYYVATKTFTLKVPERQILTVGGQKVLIVHGHKQSVDFGYDLLAFEAQLSEANVAVYGHTHCAKELYYGNNNEYKFINSGSISLPRGGLPPSFAILNFCGKNVMPVFMQIKRNHGGTLDYSSFNPLW